MLTAHRRIQAEQQLATLQLVNLGFNGGEAANQRARLLADQAAGK